MKKLLVLTIALMLQAFAANAEVAGKKGDLNDAEIAHIPMMSRNTMVRVITNFANGKMFACVYGEGVRKYLQGTKKVDSAF